MNLLKELYRAMRNHKYEETPTGLFFPASKLAFESFFDISLNGGPAEVCPNLIVNQWRTKALDILYHDDLKIDNFYLAPYAGNVSPGTTWTGANFAANSTEFTNYTGNRKLWQTAAADSFQVSNSANKALFVIGADVQTTIWGVGLLSVEAKSDASGSSVLVAATKAASAKDNLEENNEITIGYTIGLNDAS